jgi:hypothetical protein
VLAGTDWTPTQSARYAPRVCHYRLHWICAALLAVGCGCAPKQEKAPATGTYGFLTNKPSKNIAQSRPDRSAAQPWTNGELSVIQTELSPATLVYCQAQTVSFFANMLETGIGGPAFAAIETEQGPKIFKPGERIDPSRMRESWFAVWWAGASGWTNWDSPWFLTLQRRPAKIQFDTNGLHFTFNDAAGYAALMPMYGYYKPLQAEQESSPFAQLKEKKKRVLTWEWFKALPADPLSRARYWASALREFPLHCEESFSVDRAHDSVVIRQSFRWLSWNDDWNTEHLKLAPVSPVLALAYKEGFAAQFSKKPFDMEIPTWFGPFYGVEGVGSYDITLPVLRYVHETAGAGSAMSGESNALYFAIWRNAHGRGDWESARQKWPGLHDEFRRTARIDWPAFSSANGTSPLEQAANALGAARVAYRLGDADAYAEACHVFARAVIQLCAQQRGLNYFRVQQPWHSMNPMNADAALSVMTAQGWQIDKPAPPSSLISSPDLALLWRDVQPASHERRQDQMSAKLERLIPGSTPTPFISSEREPANSPFSLVQAIEPAATWPRITWPNWKTTRDGAWNFGQIAISTNSPARVESHALNQNTKVWLFSQ